MLILSGFELRDCLGIHHILRESIPQIDNSDRKEFLPSQQSGSRFYYLFHCVTSGTSRLSHFEEFTSFYVFPVHLIFIKFQLGRLFASGSITSVVSGVLVSVHT